MLKITIHDECKTPEDMADVLDRIAELLREGYTSGYYPGWGLNGTVEEPPEEDEPSEWSSIGHTHPT